MTSKQATRWLIEILTCMENIYSCLNADCDRVWRSTRDGGVDVAEAVQRVGIGGRRRLAELHCRHAINAGAIRLGRKGRVLGVAERLQVDTIHALAAQIEHQISNRFLSLACLLFITKQFYNVVCKCREHQTKKKVA